MSYPFERLLKRVLITGFLTVVIVSPLYSIHALSQEDSDVVKMRIEEHQKNLQAIDKSWRNIKLGNASFEKGQYGEAAFYYEEAYMLGGEKVVSGLKLARTYEKLGRYQEGIDLLDEMIREGRLSEKGMENANEIKQRLQKGKVPLVEQIKQEFPKATQQEQKQFLESLGGEGVWDVFRNAMVAEHGGDFKKALQIYEGLLPRQAEIEKEMGVDAWAMLYPAIQRNAKQIGNIEKEKAALVWIQDHLLSPEGSHHASLSKLEPRTISHIQDRIKTLLDK